MDSLHQTDLLILRKLLDATQSGRIVWVVEANGWNSTQLAGRELLFRQMYDEAINQIGADPRAFELTIPGRNMVFFAGTEGWELMMGILRASLDEWRRESNLSFDPLGWLDAALGDLKQPCSIEPDKLIIEDRIDN